LFLHVAVSVNSHAGPWVKVALYAGGGVAFAVENMNEDINPSDARAAKIARLITSAYLRGEGCRRTAFRWVLADNGSPWFFQGERNSNRPVILIEQLKTIPASRTS
jgi:hypothetical protein